MCIQCDQLVADYLHTELIITGEATREHVSKSVSQVSPVYPAGQIQSSTTKLRLARAGLTVRPSMCRVGETNVEFIGYKLCEIRKTNRPSVHRQSSMFNIHPALRFKASNYNTGMARFPESFAGSDGSSSEDSFPYRKRNPVWPGGANRKYQPEPSYKVWRNDFFSLT
ncbi:hypothetical protein EB796_006998 [Bugula neritina]|uniref:Uncharacterized protein n=1 Tax=Bugula neritina TaxID=10212 RepID=A0A7J7K8W5_BUGNE|nr:hypothetical protein EB796_006998 [Bugula neritina]